MFDVLQILFVLYFVNVVLPPNAAYMLAGFRASFMHFLPNLFAAALPNARMSTGSNGQIYSLIGDVLFIRSEGHLLTVSLVLLVFIGIIILLVRNKNIIKDNNNRLKLKKVWKDTILGQCIHSFTYLFFLPILFFAFLQMRDYSASSAIQGFSIFCSIVYMILALLVVSWLIYRVVSFAKRYPSTMSALSKSYNIIK